MGVIVALLCLAGTFLARRQLQESQSAEAVRAFAAEFAAARSLRILRIDGLANRASAIAALPRIHAALEDDALDLLYLATDDELRDLLSPEATGGRARFYRFLDATGRLIPPTPPAAPGEASPAELAALAPARVERIPAHGVVISSAADGATRATEFSPAFPNQPADVSYGSDPASPGGATLRFFATPTPGCASSHPSSVMYHACERSCVTGRLSASTENTS